MTERTFHTQLRHCTICDRYIECSVALSTQASPWGMRTTDTELSICKLCLGNMLKAFPVKL